MITFLIGSILLAAYSAITKADLSVLNSLTNEDAIVFLLFLICDLLLFNLLKGKK